MEFLVRFSLSSSCQSSTWLRAAARICSLRLWPPGPGQILPVLAAVTLPKGWPSTRADTHVRCFYQYTVSCCGVFIFTVHSFQVLQRLSPSCSPVTYLSISLFFEGLLNSHTCFPEKIDAMLSLFSISFQFPIWRDTVARCSSRKFLFVIDTVPFFFSWED